MSSARDKNENVPANHHPATFFSALGTLTAAQLAIVVPVKNRINTLFDDASKILNNTTTRSLHTVFRAKKLRQKKQKKAVTYFVKEVNPTDSATNPMPLLEAIISNYYELLMVGPEQVAVTRAHYRYHENELLYDKVSSKEIINFKSAVDCPLTDKDIEISSLNAGIVTVRDLERVDEDIKAAGMTLNPAYRNNCVFALPTGDILNYRLIKGLAVGLVTSYIMQEDDTSRNNISKDGKRLDFDMSLWPVLYEYKEAISFLDMVVRQTIDWYYRRPYEGKFKVTAKDIAKFPDLEDAKPHYWPTSQPPALTQEIRDALAKRNLISNNAFEPNDNDTYKKLATNQVFVYHKYKTFLKFILTSPLQYKLIALLHTRNDYKLPKHNNQSIAEVLHQHMDKRLQEIRQVLINMPEFQRFLVEDGDSAYEIIAKEWAQRNERIEAKIKKHPNTSYVPDLIISQAEMKVAFENLRTECSNIAKMQAGNSTNIFSEHRVIKEYMPENPSSELKPSPA